MANGVEFWTTTSNYSVIVCSIALIVKLFFRQYLEDIIVPILLIGVIAFVIFAISELMKFILKRKS